MAAVGILVSGVVQGVGFRPYCSRLASKLGLSGFVRNLGDAGVELHLEGGKASIMGFLNILRKNHPPKARIDAIQVLKARCLGFRGFRILESRSAGFPGIMPADSATCGRCLKELRDEDDRRRNYGFINCTDCGPRFTAVRKAPFDRSNTSFRKFKLCPECRREYSESKDRRFHAQSICCPECGPKYTLRDAGGKQIACADPIGEATRLLEKGRVVAVKGIGGFHLAAKATDDRVLKKLRLRLKRPQQPFALMGKGVEVVRKFAHVSRQEKKLLESSRRPIVLLEKKGKPPLISNLVSPGLHNIGVVLPYAPVHHLLFASMRKEPVLVLTSANIHGEPMLTDEGETLAGMADFILTHNLEIVNRCDDSVLRINTGRETFVRRSRGYVPEPVKLRLESEKTVLAFGAELNNTACLLKGDRAFLTQHIGDTTKTKTLEFLDEAVRRILTLTSTRKIDAVACDLHPDFHTTRLAEKYARKHKTPLIRVQHHIAHMLSLAAESRYSGGFVAVVCDGFGYGLDGKAWGGEVLMLKDDRVERAGHLQEQPMPGLDYAAEYPARMVAGILYEEYGEHELKNILKRNYIRGFKHGATEIDITIKQIKNNINTIPTTSAGRFLDAVSALLGVCARSTYEGEAAMKLESCAIKGRLRHDLPIAINNKENTLNTTLILDRVLELKESRRKTEDIAASAQKALAEGLSEIALKTARENKIDRIGFSGGVAYNNAILERIKERVERGRLKFMQHTTVPPGDGGISLGQAYYAGIF